MTNPITVRGGADGIEAHYNDITATARLYGQAANNTAAVALRLHRYLAHCDVLAAAPFDPIGAAHFEFALLSALDGPGGVSIVAMRCGALDVALRGAALAYLGADRVVEAAVPLANAFVRLPAADIAFDTTLRRTLDPSAAVQKWITTDPALADIGIDATSALLGAGSVQAAAGLLGRLYPDGHARVDARGVDGAADAAGPPRSLADVVAGLSRRDEGRPGEIDVRILTHAGPGELRRVVVDIPGTKNWSLARRNTDVTSLATNLRALTGVSTTYERGVTQAMHQAGVRPDDEVMLVGHSEGGMVAISAAMHFAESREFHVSHVVTAGAPLGTTSVSVPSSVQVLALENEGDLVPHLDGAENPDRVNVTTVGLHRDQGGIEANHSLAMSYQPGAADVDASTDASTRAYLDGARGFFTSSAVRTVTFQISRDN
ncbi:MAG: hypothetical protein ABJB98_11190 [Actinomycetota bacterium]